MVIVRGLCVRPNPTASLGLLTPTLQMECPRMGSGRAVVHGRVSIVAFTQLNAGDMLTCTTVAFHSARQTCCRHVTGRRLARQNPRSNRKHVRKTNSSQALTSGAAYLWSKYVHRAHLCRTGYIDLLACLDRAPIGNPRNVKIDIHFGSPSQNCGVSRLGTSLSVSLEWKSLFTARLVAVILLRFISSLSNCDTKFTSRMQCAGLANMTLFSSLLFSTEVRVEILETDDHGNCRHIFIIPVVFACINICFVLLRIHDHLMFSQV